MTELKRGDIPEPGGSQTYHNALVAERNALQAFSKALDDFKRLVLDGKLPEENQ